MFVFCLNKGHALGISSCCGWVVLASGSLAVATPTHGQHKLCHICTFSLSKSQYSIRHCYAELVPPCCRHECIQVTFTAHLRGPPMLPAGSDISRHCSSVQYMVAWWTPRTMPASSCWVAAAVNARRLQLRKVTLGANLASW
jgi:hypothetical protein